MNLQNLSDDALIDSACLAEVSWLSGNSFDGFYVEDYRIELKRRLSERNQWHPIETAPKDGTEILACIYVYNNKTNESYFENHIIYFNDEDGCIGDYQGWDFDDYNYWQPLPPSPKED